MRIIGGKYSGRIIQAPSGLPVRPTTDYAKSALFNILSHRFDLEGFKVLDLFAGIGGVSLEFLSRGAASVTAVDQHLPCLKFIRETANKLGEENLETVKSDVFKYLKSCTEKFDLIFADPPFDLKETDKIPQLVFEANLLKEGGWLIIEHQSKRKLVTSVPFETRIYGNCAFSIFSMGGVK